MDKPFVYGVAVSGDNFTDRKKETKRLKMNFESGVNSILISPRRMGKTSIVGKVMSSMTDPKIKVVMMDIYDCRSESDFYERFAASIIKGVAGKVDRICPGISWTLLCQGFGKSGSFAGLFPFLWNFTQGHGCR